MLLLALMLWGASTSCCASAACGCPSPVPCSTLVAHAVRASVCVRPARSGAGCFSSKFGTHAHFGNTSSTD